MPALTGLTAYRIVQEALTNTHKHAGSSAVVRVRWRSRRTRCGSGWTTTAAGVRRGAGMGTGHGMIGMQERVKAVGGTFAAGPRAGRRVPGRGGAAGAGSGWWWCGRLVPEPASG